MTPASPVPHAWELTAVEAIALQKQLAPLVEKRDRLGDVRFVAGIDVGFPGGGDLTRAAVAVLSFPDLKLVEVATADVPTTFPYVPGLLSFRETPAVLAAFERLRQRPDLLIVDGQGYAHRRRFGIACHLGVWLDLPSIGSAKSLLVGKHGDLDDVRGATAPLVHRGEVIGVALRTRPNVKPLYVSIGHRVSLETATRLVTECCTRYRLPEPQRQAHMAASNVRQGPSSVSL